MPQKSRRQNATELRNAGLSVVSCKPLLDGGARSGENQELRDSTGDVEETYDRECTVNPLARARVADDR